MRNKGVLAVLAVVLLCGSLSPLAAAPVIERGIDVFTTVANGKTFYDFGENPIPAGFFCKSSRPFAGRVALKGLPLEVEGKLRNADTVIERLDDAVFDASGVATTRIRFRALSLVSIAPIKTGCGSYHVYVSLGSQQQRVTTMRISHSEAAGGTFLAPLAVNARMTFVPVRGKAARNLELNGSFTFPAVDIPWSFEAGPATKRIGSVVVDTNGDLAPDTPFSGTSNFAPGWSAKGSMAKIGPCFECEPESCHEYQGKQHCTGPVLACGDTSFCP